MPRHPTDPPRPDSLTRFFERRPAATLDDCDREPLHESGAIQACGALLAFDPGSRRVEVWSENLPALLELDRTDPPRDAPVETWLPELAGELGRITADTAVGRHRLLEARVERAAGRFDLVTHRHHGSVRVELLPDRAPEADALRERLSAARRTLAAIAHARDGDEACREAVRGTRALTGFARVDLYRFEPDWCGRVVAEDRAAHMPAYLGLHFPDTDIPRQARELYRMLPSRSVASVHDELARLVHAGRPDRPFDLTWSLLRSVSPLHTEYLRNMGVEASFSVGVVLDGRLWGLIACHHDAPGLVPFEVWDLARAVADALAERLARDRVERDGARIRALRALQRRLAERRDADPSGGLAAEGEALRRLLFADGLAVRVGDRWWSFGRTPTEDELDALDRWLAGPGAGADTDEAGAEAGGPDRARSEDTGPEDTGRVGTGREGTGRRGVGLERTGSERTGPDRAGPGAVGERSDPGRAATLLATSALAELRPAPPLDAGLAAGLLAVPTGVRPPCRLVWFRGPQKHEVRWAGRPARPSASPDGPRAPEETPARLSPRRSFETWVAVRGDRSRPWDAGDRALAREVWTELLDRLAGRAVALSGAAQDLSLVERTVHELRAPLARLRAGLGAGDGRPDPAEVASLAAAGARAEHLASLLADLLAPDADAAPRAALRAVDPARLLERTVGRPHARDPRAPVRLRVGGLPAVLATPEALAALFRHWGADARLRAGDRRPTLAVDGSAADGRVELRLSDDAGPPTDPTATALLVEVGRRLAVSLGGELERAPDPAGGLALRLRLAAAPAADGEATR